MTVQAFHLNNSSRGKVLHSINVVALWTAEREEREGEVGRERLGGRGWEGEVGRERLGGRVREGEGGKEGRKTEREGRGERGRGKRRVSYHDHLKVAIYSK